MKDRIQAMNYWLTTEGSRRKSYEWRVTREAVNGEKMETVAGIRLLDRFNKTHVFLSI